MSSRHGAFPWSGIRRTWMAETMSATDALLSRSGFAHSRPGCSVSHCGRRRFRRLFPGSLFANPSATTFQPGDTPKSAPVRSVRSKRDPAQATNSRNQPDPDCLPTGQSLRASTAAEKPNLPLALVSPAPGAFPACQPCRRKSACFHRDQHTQRTAKYTSSCRRQHLQGGSSGGQ